MNVPILMYHSVSRPGTEDIRPPGYWLTPDDFSSQLAALRESGAVTVGLADLLAASRGGTTLPAGAIVITFDDGYLNNLREALPRLLDQGFKAVFFVTAGAVGNPHMLEKDDLVELRRAGMEVGSHGMTHRFYGGLSLAELRRELAESRALLADAVGVPVRFFSLPRGYLPRRLPLLAREAGYLGMCISNPGLNSPVSDPFRWRRFPVRSGDRPASLTAILRGAGTDYRCRYLKEKIRSLLRVRYGLRCLRRD